MVFPSFTYHVVDARENTYMRDPRSKAKASSSDESTGKAMRSYG